MERVMLQDFVLMQVYDRLKQLLDEYHETMHPVLKQFNDRMKEIYEYIFLKIRDEVPLSETEARELYNILKETYAANERVRERCFEACITFCFPLIKEEIIELELKHNYDAHRLN